MAVQKRDLSGFFLVRAAIHCFPMKPDPRKKPPPPAAEEKLPGTRMTCMAGQVVCKQGSPSNQFFFIESGKVEVVAEKDGHSVRMAEIGAGEVFGELGVLDNELRVASVQAAETSKIVVMPREDLENRIAAVEDPVIRALIRGLSQRLRTTTDQRAQDNKALSDLQSRTTRLMDKVHRGIDPARRDAFDAEITPLLDQIEAVLDKYRPGA